MTALAARPVDPADRLAMAVCLAVLFHAIIILGVGFAPPRPPEPRYSTMEVVLVQQQSEAPEEADYLAQANLEGGGESAPPQRPATPLATPAPEVAPLPAAPPVPALDPVPVEQRVTAAAPAAGAGAEGSGTPAPAMLAAERDTAAHPVPQEPAPAEAQQADAGTASASHPSRPTPSAAELIAASFAIASLSAEVQQRLDARANRPRRKFISASTREYKYAAYMEAWRAKVERVGNLNYPEEARRRHLSGSLILEVVLKPDGTVAEMIVRRSSGHRVLDDAARRIVELAAPFAPFPEQIRAEVDLLHVTRTWQFLDSARFSSR